MKTRREKERERQIHRNECRAENLSSLMQRLVFIFAVGCFWFVAIIGIAVAVWLAIIGAVRECMGEDMTTESIGPEDVTQGVSVLREFVPYERK